ncbi:MAG: DUF2121 domain-containing protein [Methanobacteriaceae archaeon]|nr:DUF2121 domain-containing protein [Methanobacteriaceae archaeon]
MSLIMTYIGRNGCVMIGDKRRIGFFGDKDSIKLLEDELYSGKIKNDQELINRSDSLNVTIKVIDDAKKVRSLGDVVVGEVRFKTTMETRRKRIYATTNGYNIVELLGSNIEKIQKGETSIIVFGNKMTKKIANDLIRKKWKSKTNLKDIGDLFKAIMNEVAHLTPSISKDYDIYIKSRKMNKNEAQKILRESIVRDVKLLEKWRSKLKDDLLEKARSIEMSRKIVIEGEIGRVSNLNGNQIEVILNDDIEALDINWNIVAKPGETVFMGINDPLNVKEGDLVVIEKENLCIKRTKSQLNCEVILCKRDQ